MKRLKLFPKTSFYTMGLMLFVIVIAHVLMYLLVPKMGMVFSPTGSDTETITFSIREEKIVIQAIRQALPVSLVCCLLISAICSLLFSKAIADPIKRISASTGRMMKLDRAASCPIHSKDEIGLLAQNVNDLYSNLLSTIEHLEQEKDRVSEMERAKVDFLRAASHELKTPVTALNATLENMILGVGKYQDYATYLPECKEMVEQLSSMIQEILETSRLNAADEQPAAVDLSELLEELCEPYQMIAAAHRIPFSLDLPEHFSATLPVGQFSKVVSNVLANAVAYTAEGDAVSVYMNDRSLVIENQCVPIPNGEIRRLFEPFYRPDLSRSRESGGNGLGLYIVDTLLTAMNIPYTFVPMKSPPGMCFSIQLYDKNSPAGEFFISAQIPYTFHIPSTLGCYSAGNHKTEV